MLTNLKRICKFACVDFNRNKGIAIAAIFILVVTIMLTTSLLLFQTFTGFLVYQIQKKIDVTAYFREEASEEDILKVREEISKMSPDIKEVKYVSKEQAMEDFTQKHRDNNVFLKALEEVGTNPFLASLNIQTNGEPGQYQEISSILQSAQFNQFIDSVDFSKKEDTIEKVFNITSYINKFGLLLSFILVIVAILVVFNTIKLTINNSKEEISTMRIVGASNWFIRGPFIVQGIIYGFIAFVICILISGFGIYLISPKLEIILPGFNIFSYFLSNFWFFVLLQLSVGTGLGAATSFIAVRKHLQV